MFSFLRRWFGGLSSVDLARPERRDEPWLVLAAEDAAPAGTDEGIDEEAPPPDAWWRIDAAPVAPVDSGEHGVNRELYEQLVRVLDDANLEIPRIPQVAQRALLALRDDSANFGRVAELVSQDPGLAAQVLRVTNSVAYRGVREIRSLDQAFARLGVRTLRSVILGASLRGLMIRTGGSQQTVGEQIWRRSLAGGVIMRHLAPRFDLPEEEAFLIGLLHDVGVLVALTVVHDYQQLHARGVSRALFDRVCAEWHEHIGMRLAEAWNLPDPLPMLIGSHHRAPAPDDALRTYRLLILLSDEICGLLDLGPRTTCDLLETTWARELELRPGAETYALLAPLPQLVRQIDAET